MAHQKRDTAGRPTSMTHSKAPNRQGKPRSKTFTPRKRTSECEDDGICDLCVLPIKIYAIGHCNHPICHRCSAKMRILCEQTHCAVCRVEMKKVIYSKSKRSFADANALKLLKGGRENSHFTDDITKDEYNKLFEYRCSSCTDRPPDPTFDKLQAHVRKDHKLQFCDICIKFNKNFPDEYKTYSREGLGRHRRLGDEDDTSHRGHPLCEFCDVRYLDNDSLLLHLRREHFFCHFCDKAGTNEYYDGYHELRKHYKGRHYLCEEGDCRDEKFTSVFNSELDFKAHQNEKHYKSLTRQQQKAERKIDLGFQYPKPSRGGRGSGGFYDVPDGARGRGRGRGKLSREDEDLEMAKVLSLSEQDNVKKNPPGGNSTRPTVEQSRVQTRDEETRATLEETAPPNLAEDFPSLGSTQPDEPTLASPYTYLSINSENAKHEGVTPPQKKEEKTNTTVSAAVRVATARGLSVGKVTPEDFPTLGSANKAKPVNQVGIWASSGKPPTSKSNAPPQPVSINMPAAMFGSRKNVDLKSKAEFPTLGGGAAPATRSIWGQSSSLHNQTTAMVQSKKANKRTLGLPKSTTPMTMRQPSNKTQPPKQPVSSDVITRDETVSIRIGSGKHSVKLTSAKHTDEIADIEKPIEVAGVGNTSVKTVTADTFSLLSGSKNDQSTRARENNFNVQTEEFPELGGAGGKGGRIKGIGASKLTSTPSWGTSDSNKGQKTPISLSDISYDIFPSSSVERADPSRGKRAHSNKQVKAKDTTFNAEDFPSFATAPPISSYPTNWQETDTVMVADAVVQEKKFEAQEGDFPSLADEGSNKQKNPVVKKGKKKRKNKQAQNAADLSKHFNSVTIDDTQKGGHLDALLQSRSAVGDAQKSLSSLLDENDMFASQTNNREYGRDLANGHDDIETDSYDVILPPKPDHDDINGRNVWLIKTAQQLCGSESNFSEFKACSAEFRQGKLYPRQYYEKCKTLLGEIHFPIVFSELVDLLPDEDKREALMLLMP